MKAVALLALLPAASAFVAPAPRMLKQQRGRSMNMLLEDKGEPGGVIWLPEGPAYWDPLGLASEEPLFNRFQLAEIKHGRIAMLGALHYIITDGLGVKLPGNLGPVAFNDIPVGLSAIKAVPQEGWAQVLIFCAALETLAPQKEDRVPGEVQPVTPAFKTPGTIEYRTKELNNGRLAMVSMLGIWAGELVSGGQTPFETLYSVIGK